MPQLSFEPENIFMLQNRLDKADCFFRLLKQSTKCNWTHRTAIAEATRYNWSTTYVRHV